MTLKIEFARHSGDTKIMVDGENILPKLHARRLELNAVAQGPNTLTEMSLKVLADDLYIDADPKIIIKALREEADRIESMISDDD
jgi:hypothetical protein